ncbi:Alpha/beta hydrolase fold-1 [Trinorchestia longiramus]|nr:Alpha/beta hydrolase fold-1 [Trinorchestia longiramus]
MSSEEHLSAVERVLQHELRTDSSLFLEDDVPDCRDHTVDCAIAADTVDNSTAVLPDVGSPWRSRSCPCSPKTAARTLLRDPELDGDKRQSVHYRSNKFSLSGSLLAIHRQASSSLRSSASKNGSLHNSLKLKKRRSYCSIDEEDGSSILSDEELSCEDVSNQSSVVKKPIRASHSLPALKLQRISMTHHSEATVTEEAGDVSGQWHLESPTSSADGHSQEGEAVLHGSENRFSFLPDLIPGATSARSTAPGQTPELQNKFATSSQEVKEGFINLGFDGHGESSDAPDDPCLEDPQLPSNEATPIKVPSPIHSMSVGYLTSPERDVSGFDLSVSSLHLKSVDTAHPLSEVVTLSNPSFSSGLLGGASSCDSFSAPLSNITTAPSTAPCSPSALRVRVMDGPLYTASEQRILATLPLSCDGTGSFPIRSNTLCVPTGGLASNVHVLHSEGLRSSIPVGQTEILRPNIQIVQSEELEPGTLLGRNECLKLNIQVNQNEGLRPNTLVVPFDVGKNMVKRADSTAPSDHDQQQLLELQKQLIASEGTVVKKTTQSNTNPRSGQLIDRRKEGWQPPVAPSAPPEVEEEISPNLSEARTLVYWWQQGHDASAGAESTGDANGEYCLKQGQCGDKRLPLLMFVHGVGGSADDWHHQLWYFVAAGYEVVAPDLLGHGLSSAPDNAACYRFPRLLEQLRLLYDLFVPKGRKCVLVGHGYGCALVSALSRSRPSSVPLMALISCGGPTPLLPPPSHINTKSSSGGGWGASYSPYFGLDSSAGCGCCGAVAEELGQCFEALSGLRGAGLAACWPALSVVISTACWLACCKPCLCAKREAVYQTRGKQLCGGALRNPGASATPAYVLRHVVRGQRWLEGDVAFHRRITVPVLLLHGLRDTTVPLLHMCEMEKTIPRAFLEVFGSCGHEVMTDAPEEVNSSLHRFLLRWSRLSS